MNIYIDSWVPHHLTFIIQSSPCLPIDSRLSALITASGYWNVSEIYRLFTFTAAKFILYIPLSCDTGDRRIWHFTRNGSIQLRVGTGLHWNFKLRWPYCLCVGVLLHPLNSYGSNHGSLKFYRKRYISCGVSPTMISLLVRCFY